MNSKSIIGVLLMVFLIAGCASTSPETSAPATTASTSSIFPRSQTIATVPNATPSPQPSHARIEIISEGKLNCSLLGANVKCVDGVLGIEFEQPVEWGEIDAVLRTGGESGYTYDYYWQRNAATEVLHLLAGGRSIDFAEGREGMSTDFSGYGDAPFQQSGSCDSGRRDLYPVCQKTAPGVAWMIRFPNAKIICDSPPGYYTTPVFRIEVDLPSNPTIIGFVFEAPFASNEFTDRVERELYPLLGMESDMIPTKCGVADQQAFDAQIQPYLESFEEGTTDDETLQKLNELMQLVTSIRIR